MAFEFLRNGKLFIEDTALLGTYYRLHVAKDVSFSQTFKQEGINKRTLHNLNNLFEGAVTHSANPADFNFTIFILDETTKHQHTALDFLLQYSGNSLRTFNLYYIDNSTSPTIQYKVENCVVTNGVFNIPRVGFITVTFSGQGTKLIRTTGSNISDPQFVSYPKYSISKELIVNIDNIRLKGILGVTLELQNNINWVDKATIQATRYAVDAGTSVYPSNFVLQNRTLGGSIQQYIDQNVSGSYSNLLTWKNNALITIKTGLSADNPQLEVTIPEAAFTNRPNIGDVFTQSYDFRLVSNPLDLSTLFIY